MFIKWKVMEFGRKELELVKEAADFYKKACEKELKSARWNELIPLVQRTLSAKIAEMDCLMNLCDESLLAE